MTTKPFSFVFASTHFIFTSVVNINYTTVSSNIDVISSVARM